MRWTVGRKIGLGFLAALLAVILTGWATYRSTHAMVAAAEARKHSFDVLQHLLAVESLLKDAETGQRGFVITGEESYLQPYEDGVRLLPEELKTLRGLLAPASNDQPSQEARKAQGAELDHLERVIQTKLAELKQTIDLRRSQGFDAAARVVGTNAGKQAMDAARLLLAQIRSSEEGVLEQRKEAADRSTQVLYATIKFGIGATAAMLLLIGLITSRNIAGPLGEVTVIADRIAHGNLSSELEPVPRRDEVGDLRNAFHRMNESLRYMAARAERIAGRDLLGDAAGLAENDMLGQTFTRMTTNLRGIMQEIAEAVNVLAASATEILSSSSQLASSAAETAAAVTETTTTLEQVKQTSRLSSDKARFVANNAQQAAQIVQSGSRAVGEAIDGTNRIRQQMEAIADSIVRLSEQGQTIGEIIASVDDLAAQSNLLAVNASIEAAKAGDYGRGFAVVAQEVKSLADQSKQATTQVRGILTQIQKATNSAVVATDQGTKSVEAGMAQSKLAGDSIRLLSETISQSAQAATQIAASSHQQFVGMDQVAMAMENIRVASRQTLASTKQAEVAAQSLHSLGQKLKNLVGTFKT